MQIKQDSKSKKKWYTTEGGGVYATASAGQVTGFGAGAVDEEEEDDEDADLDEFIAGIEAQANEEHPITKKKKFGGAIIIDDPIKPDDADSPVTREKINNRFDSTIRNRVNSRNTPIIIIMQRLHPMDLSGYVQDVEPGEWEVISMPALFVNRNGELEALWAHKHTVQALQKLKKVNDLVFERQYQQNPKPKEGLLFPEDELYTYNPNTVDLDKLAEFKLVVIDPADEGGDDLATLLGVLVENKIYVKEVIYNSHGTDINEPACIDLIVNNKVNAAVIEGNSAWMLFSKAIRKKVTDPPEHGGRGHRNCTIRIIKNTTNKHTRILARSAFIRNNFIFRSDYKEHPHYLRFMQNVTSYMRIQEGSNKNKHDDAVDSLAEMANYFERNFSHLW